MTVAVVVVYVAVIAAMTVAAVLSFRADMERLREWREEHPVACGSLFATAILFEALAISGVITEPGLKRIMAASSALIAVVFVLVTGWLLFDPGRRNA